MTGRWIIEDDEPLQVVDIKGEHDPVCVLYSEDSKKVRDLLNEKEQKIEDLEQAYFKLMNAHSLLYDVCADLGLDKDEYYNDLLYLEKENEQLKQKNQELIEYGRELLEYINSPPKHYKSIFDAVVCFKDKKGDME